MPDNEDTAERERQTTEEKIASKRRWMAKQKPQDYGFDAMFAHCPPLTIVDATPDHE